MKDTKTIIEGALTAAIFIVIFLICFYIPPISIVGMFFWPLPLMYYIAKRGIKAGFIAFLACLVLTLLFTHLVTAASALIFLVGGLVMGYMLYLKKSAFAILTAGSLATILCLVAYYGALVSFFHIDPLKEIINSAVRFSKEAEKLSPESAKEQWRLYRDMLNLLPTLTPMILTMGGIIFTFIVELVSAPIIRRLGVEFPKWPPFREWTLPKSLIWYYLIALAILMFGGLEQGSTLFMVTFNVFEILEMAMVLQGVTFIFFFFHSKGTNISIPVIITVIGLILPFTLYIIRILGIIDLGIGLRARIRKQ
ncbi:MAG: YybS family protein [Tuberibacillus sp.]